MIRRHQVLIFFMETAVLRANVFHSDDHSSVVLCLYVVACKVSVSHSDVLPVVCVCVCVCVRGLFYALVYPIVMGRSPSCDAYVPRVCANVSQRDGSF
jgi:hypothetical protein